MVDYAELEYQKENPNIDGAFRLFLAITLQAIKDIHHMREMLKYGCKPNVEQKKDYRSAVVYFQEGGNYDYWLELHGLSGGKWEDLRSDMLSLDPKTNTTRKERKKQKIRDMRDLLCDKCNQPFRTNGNHVRYCPTCRIEVMKQSQKDWRKREKEKEKVA